MAPDETIYVIPQPSAVLVVEQPGIVHQVIEEIEVVQTTTPGPQGPPGAAGPMTVSFGMEGPLAAGVGLLRWYNDFGYPRRLVSVRATVGSSPIGSPVTVDMNIDDVTAFTTQANRPSVAPGELSDLGTPDVSVVPMGSYLTADIDAVGNVAPGTHLYVQAYLI